MAVPLEKILEDKAVMYALGLGYIHTKMNALGNRGKPDQWFCAMNGVSFWIEFKRAGEDPSALQVYWARRLTQYGQLVYGCEDFQHAKAILKNHMDSAALPIAGLATHDAAGFRWTIPRSGTWENFDVPYGFQNSKGKRPRR